MKLKKGDRIMIPATVGRPSDDPDLIWVSFGEKEKDTVMYRSFVERAVSERRERIATAAMQGLCGGQYFLAQLISDAKDADDRNVTIAKASLKIADALIAALDSVAEQEQASDSKPDYANMDRCDKCDGCGETHPWDDTISGRCPK